jgi:hypothetical protein
MKNRLSVIGSGFDWETCCYRMAQTRANWKTGGGRFACPIEFCYDEHKPVSERAMSETTITVRVTLDLRERLEALGDATRGK